VKKEVNRSVTANKKPRKKDCDRQLTGIEGRREGKV